MQINLPDVLAEVEAVFDEYERALVGEDFAVADIEFRRAGSDRIGRQSQTWVRMPGVGWRVVAAHVSLMA